MKESYYGGIVSSDESCPIKMLECFGKLVMLSNANKWVFIFLSWLQRYHLREEGWSDEECRNILVIEEKEWMDCKKSLLRAGMEVLPSGNIINPSVVHLIQIEKNPIPIKRSDLTKKEWKKIRLRVFYRDNYTCQYCGERNFEMTVDHIVPFSKGGTMDISNLFTACKSCNSSKSNTDLRHWLSRQ